MITGEKGEIIGNWNNEEWTKVSLGIEQLKVSGGIQTLIFTRYKPEISGDLASIPSTEINNEQEHLAVMLEGSATIIVDGKRKKVHKGSHWLIPKGISFGIDLREEPNGAMFVRVFPSK